MTIRNRISFFIGFLFLAKSLVGQVLPDQCWLLGAHEPSGQPGYNNAIIRFNGSDIDIVEQDLNMNFESTVASMVDSLGNLLFYTNGCYISNAAGDTMENGAGLNPGEMHDWTCGTTGYVAPFGAIALPSPGGGGMYILLHIGVNYAEDKKLTYGPFYYTLIDMNANAGLGKVISMNNILIDKHDLAPFSVVRHGNGRDWWVVVPEYGTDTYHKFLIDNTGVQLAEAQHIGAAISCRYIGTGAFSRNGDKYARQHNCGIFIYDFDRCTGGFSDAKYLPFPPNAFGGGGVVFTPNGKKVLASTQMSLMAVDLEAEPPTLDTIVDFLSLLGTSLELMQYGADGNLYFSTMGRGAFYHVCTNIGDTSGNIGFQFRGQPLPVHNIRTLPNLPNFRLYDFQGSPCDTLGISVSTHENTIPAPQLQISPNPATALIHIHFIGFHPTLLKLFDMTGKLILQRPCLESAVEIDLDISNLSGGLYCLSSQDKTGKLLLKQFIVSAPN